MMRIQTFPGDYLIQCGHTEAQRQLGNAVPSLMAEILGRAIREQLFDEPACREPLKLLLPRRTPVPAPEPPRPVPEKYLSRVGKHTPHPGTGKGRGALRASVAR